MARKKRKTGQDVEGKPIKVGCIIDDDIYTGRVTFVDDDALIYRPITDTTGDVRFKKTDRHSAMAYQVRVIDDTK